MKRLCHASASMPRSTGETGETETGGCVSVDPSSARRLRTAERPAVSETVPAGAATIASRAPPCIRHRVPPCKASLPHRWPVVRAMTLHCVLPLPGEKSPKPVRLATMAEASGLLGPCRRGAAHIGRFLFAPMPASNSTMVRRPSSAPRPRPRPSAPRPRRETGARQSKKSPQTVKQVKQVILH